MPETKKLLTRVVLHEKAKGQPATEKDYELLHALMEDANFARTNECVNLGNGEVETYYLPPAMYVAYGNATVTAKSASKSADEAAMQTGYPYTIVTVIYTDRHSINLVPVEPAR